MLYPVECFAWFGIISCGSKLRNWRQVVPSSMLLQLRETIGEYGC
jgi:hypothetical protein